MDKNKIVLVEWTDSYGDSGWQDAIDGFKSLMGKFESTRWASGKEFLNKATRLKAIKTAGYLVAENSKYIVIASTVYEGELKTDEIVMNMLAIPRVVIKSMKYLE